MNCIHRPIPDLYLGVHTVRVASRTLLSLGKSIKSIRRLLGIFVLSLCTACAHTGSGTGMPGDQKEDHRLRNTLIAVGAAVIVGVIAASQAQDSVRDALRTPPQN